MVYYSNEIVLSARSTQSELFEDAKEEPNYSKSLRLLDTISETQITMNLFLNNKFELAEERISVLADRSMYHAHGYGTILFIKAMMTCDRRDMESAMEAVRNACIVIERFRAKYSIAESLYRIGGQFKRLSDEEMHAELCYAEVLLFRAILNFFYDENLSSFIKGAFKIRSCYQSFKECQRILNSDCWETRNKEIQRQFEMGVRMGIGAFNLLLSTLPSKVVRLLEVVGFSGNKDIGMMELKLASISINTLRSPMASLSLLGWNLIVTYLVGGGPPDLKLCHNLMKSLIESYPNGAIVLFLRARLHLINGKIDNALFFYNKSIEVQNAYKQFHHICFWELLFAYCYIRRWDRAANQAKLLLDESRWSRCCYTYLLAILINAEKSTPKNKETVKILMNKIPSIRLRIAGKSIPVEKFCEHKAARYFRKNQLYYPHYEFIYFWNGFSILEGNPKLIESILKDIEEFWSINPSGEPDDKAIYNFLRGICFRTLKEFSKAEECFINILNSEKSLIDYFYLVPNTCFELALVRADLNANKEEVEALLIRAKAYKGYCLEMKLHFKIHHAMELLSKGKLRAQNLSQSI